MGRGLRSCRSGAACGGWGCRRCSVLTSVTVFKPQAILLLIARASPYWKVHADVPPTLLVHGTEDDIIPYVNALSLRDRLTTLGVSNQLLDHSAGRSWLGRGGNGAGA
jgi:predicted esterase